jgi:hypothetical protein
MTLRAIGNLTRCDENIMRAVGYGVIKGMVEGMTKHAEDSQVLQLCADVIGNMASVDDKKVGKAEGIKILTECSANRYKTAALSAAPPAGPPPSGGPRPPSGAPKPKPPSAAKQITNEQLMLTVKNAETLKEAVCNVLYEDGAPRALVEAMIKHYRKPELAGSCLRAMHYIGASKQLVTRMVDELSLVDQVIYIMRGIDYDVDVLRRGARVLGLVVGTENLKEKVLLAGAPHILLQAIETHKDKRELCISCYSVLAMARSPAVVAAVQEMQAIDTAISILRSHASDHEFVGVLLELLWGWAAEADLAASIASRAGPTLAQLLDGYARNPAVPDRLQHLNYILNLLIALVRQRIDPSALASCGMLGATQVVVDSIVSGNDGNIMLQQRSLVMQTVTIMMEIVKPPAKEKDSTAPLVISPAGVQALIASGAGLMLEKVLAAYKVVPDPRVAGQLLYDQSMCEKVYGVLQDLIANGYTPKAPVTLDPPEDGDIPPEATAAAAAPAPLAPKPPSKPAVLTLNPQSQAELDKMMSPTGKSIEIWGTDGKVRKARISVSANKQQIGVAFEDGKKEVTSFSVKDVRGVLLNVPSGNKKKAGGLFAGGRAPNPARSVVLEDETGCLIYHLEVPEDSMRNAFAGVFAGISGVSARAQ